LRDLSLFLTLHLILLPKKNAFLYPENPEAAFPQYQKPTLIDFRSANVDFSGFEFRGSSRKNKAQITPAEATFEVEQIEEIKEDEDGFIEVDEEDLLEDFTKMGIENASKKIKKKKKAQDGMETERQYIPLKSNKKKKNQDGCKKSRRIMKW